MKRSVYTFRNVLLLLLSTVALTTCTIIDNDLRDLPDNPAYKQVVHEEGDYYTADYQFQPWTMLVDERYNPYIRGIDYEHHVLYLNDYIPENMLPQAGNSLAAQPSDILEFGLSYKVLEVMHLEDYYAVIMKRAHTEDIYKYLVLDMEVEFGTEVVDTVDEEGNQTRALRPTRLMRPAKTRASDDDTTPDNSVKEIELGKTITLDLFELATKMALAKKSNVSKKDAFITLLAKAAVGNATGIRGTVHELHWVRRDNTEANEWKSFISNLAKNEKNDVPSESKQETSNGTVVGASTTSKSNVANKLYDAVYIEANALIEWVIEIKPSIKIKTYHNQQEKKFDYSVELCGAFGMHTSLAGSATLILDWLKLFDINGSFGKIVASVYGVPVWFQVNFLLWTLAEIGGSLSYTFRKTFSFGVGYRDNMGKEEDGFYFINNSKKMTVEENEKWDVTQDDLAKLGLGAEFHVTADIIKFSPQIILGIGMPPVSLLSPEALKAIKELPKKLQERIQEIVKDPKMDLGMNVKIEWDPYISARLGYNASTLIKRVGQAHFHFCVPLSLRDGFIVLTPWPGYEFRWNFLDALLSRIGNNKTGYWEFFPQDFYKYTAIGNVSIVCENPNVDASYPPIFDIDFDIEDLGVAFKGENGQWVAPVIKVFEKSDEARVYPIVEHTFERLTLKDVGKHFTYKIDNPSLKRDKEYVLEISMMTKTDEGIDKRQYYEDHLFISSSPSAHIYMHKIIYRTAKYWERALWNACGESWKTKEPENVAGKEYNIKFRTQVGLTGQKDIKELGFLVGKNRKKYVVKDLPKDLVQYQNVSAIWNLPSSKEAKRSLEIIPYVIQKQATSMQFWPSPYVADLNYYDSPRDPNWGGEGKPYKWVDMGHTYVEYGLDEVEANKRDNEVEVKGLARSVNSRYPNDDKNTFTYTINIAPEDLE